MSFPGLHVNHGGRGSRQTKRIQKIWSRRSGQLNQMRRERRITATKLLGMSIGESKQGINKFM
jgi:hypothetical protein